MSGDAGVGGGRQRAAGRLDSQQDQMSKKAKKEPAPTTQS
jgi:hypothetical protein